MRELSPALLQLQRHFRHAASRLEAQHITSSGLVDQPTAARLRHGVDLLECLKLNRPFGLCREFLLNTTVLQLNVHQPEHDVTGRNESSATSSPFLTVFDEEEEDVKELYKTVVPVMLIGCCLSMIFNLFLVFSVRWVRRVSPTLCLSLSLAVADAYASLVIGLGLIVNSLLPTVYGLTLGLYNLCYILVLEAFRLGGVVIIVLHLLALAINHYIGILRPLHYHAIVTRRTAMIAIVIMWLLPVAFFMTYFSLVPDDGFQSIYCSRYDFLLRVPFRVTTSVLFFVPLLLMSAMYAHMFVVVRRHQNGLVQCPSSRQLHKNVKAIITTLLILGTYILGWMPGVIFFVLTCLDCPIPFPQIPIPTRVPVLIFINSMIVAKSFVDPIIYVIRMPEIKSAVSMIWKTRCGFDSSVATDIPLHSRTDVNRLTFQLASRKAKFNGVTRC
ncbi:adrenocorticotropic hormone receptor-like [Uloborus diversus]|uniref:adrenocorticotropic hormone receptor-like n=1 Tax=Uloborus diversus TaxID=327109 RepID=UPI00240A50FC|nr:adrenocorticotropic hormone receptor-like [Uloborus diversus]